MFHRIKNVKVVPDYKINVQFVDGVTKIYDASALFNKHESYMPLKNNIELFGDITVDEGGYSVIWDDNIDISCNELWKNGIEIDS